MPMTLHPAGRTALVFALGAFLAACSGTRPPSAASGPSGETAPPPPTYPAYETFDASRYDAAPPGRVEIVHDVPAVVMAGRVVVPARAGAPAPTERTPRQVDGYRVQIFSSNSRTAAEQTRDGAVAWWARARTRAGRAGRAGPARGLPPAVLPRPTRRLRDRGRGRGRPRVRPRRVPRGLPRPRRRHRRPSSPPLAAPTADAPRSPARRRSPGPLRLLRHRAPRPSPPRPSR